MNNKFLMLAALGLGLYWVWNKPAAAATTTQSTAGVPESFWDVGQAVKTSVAGIQTQLPAVMSVETPASVAKASNGVTKLASGATVISTEAAMNCAEWGGADGVTCLRKRA